MISIFLSYQSKKRDVVAFLNELKNLLTREDFDSDTDLKLIRKRKQGDDQKFSTPYTLLDLDYDIEDVVDRLKELTIEEYSETKIDRDDIHPPVLFVFGKDIELKIKDHKKQILCVSFHYAKDEMAFPYA